MARTRQKLLSPFTSTFRNAVSAASVAPVLINRWGVKAPDLPVRLEYPNKGEDERDDDRDETPDTPLDEPEPVPVRDPPPQLDDQGPFVVADR